MGLHARLSDVAVGSALDAQDMTRASLRAIESALVDGVVSQEEAHGMLRFARLALRATEDVVVATERANVGQLAAVSMLTVTPFNPHLRKQMREVGLTLDNVIQFPQAEPDSVA